MKHKLKSRLPGEISTTSNMQMIVLLMAESEEKLESLSMRVREKSGLQLNIQKIRPWHPVPSLHGEVDGEIVETVSDFILGWLQNHCRW